MLREALGGRERALAGGEGERQPGPRPAIRANEGQVLLKNEASLDGQVSDKGIGLGNDLLRPGNNDSGGFR